LGEQTKKFIICDPLRLPELPPPIRRGRGGLGRLGSERRVQQIADSPNPKEHLQTKGLRLRREFEYRQNLRQTPCLMFDCLLQAFPKVRVG
jgi:hypothetical protein